MTPEEQLKIYIDINFRSRYGAAKALGLSQQTIAMIMQGKANLSIQTLLKLRELGVPLVFKEPELTKKAYTSRLDRAQYRIVSRLNVIRSVSEKKYNSKIRALNRILELDHLEENLLVRLQTHEETKE